MSLNLGDPAPVLDLPDTNGRRHRLDGDRDAPAVVVVWTCNHCPYALAWHDRILQAARDYHDADVRFYAVNSNDAARYPRDSFQAMKERVERDGGWPLPYLHDESQDAARAFGARVTPDVFVFDAERFLAYRGAPDANWEDPSLNAAWLRGAIDDLIDGGPVALAETEPVGCSIKWRL